MLVEQLSREPIPLSRPLVYKGEEILDLSMKKLRILVNKEINNEERTDEEKRIQQWLGRLESVIRRDEFYSLSIEEAADIGFID